MNTAPPFNTWGRPDLTPSRAAAFDTQQAAQGAQI